MATTFDLGAFETVCIKLIEEGGYAEALSQLERVRSLLNEICTKLRDKTGGGSGSRGGSRSASKRRTADSLPALAGNRSTGPPRRRSNFSSTAGPAGRSQQGFGVGGGGGEDLSEDVAFRLGSLESRLKKAEMALLAKEEANRVLTADLRQSKARAKESEGRVRSLQHSTRSMEKKMVAFSADNEKVRNAMQNSEYSKSLENELRKRSAVVSSLSVKLEAMTEKAKAYEIKVKLVQEQSKQFKEAKMKAVTGSTDKDKSVLQMERRMVSLKEKLKTSQAALQFCNDELDTREVEVAQLRVSLSMAEEELKDWQSNDDGAQQKLRHSSVALRNVLRDKELLQSKLVSEIEEVEESMGAENQALREEIEELTRS